MRHNAINVRADRSKNNMKDVGDLVKKILFIMVAVFTLQAHADTTSATITAASNYIWRGLTFSGAASGTTNASAGLPVIQGSFDYAHSSGFGAGVFVGSSDTYNFDKSEMERDSEFDPTLSYTFSFDENFKIYAAVAGYWYVSNSSNNSTDYQLAFSWKTLKLEGSYMPNYFGTKSSDSYYRLSANPLITDKVALVLGVGSSNFSDESKVGFKNYIDYKAGLSYTVGNIAVEGAYTTTNRKSAESQLLRSAVSQDFNDKAATLSASYTF